MLYGHSPFALEPGQAETSRFTGVTLVLGSIPNPSSSWMESSSPTSTPTGRCPARRTRVRTGNHTEKLFVFIICRLIVVRPLLLLDRARRHEHLLTRLADIDDIPLVGKDSRGSIMLKIMSVRRITGRVANSPLLVPQQACGKRRPGDDCIGFVANQVPMADRMPDTWL
jgi:hypothetical protein